MMRPAAICSIACAVQPTTRPKAKIAVNASRGVLYAGAGTGGRWADASRDAAARLRDQINAARAR